LFSRQTTKQEKYDMHRAFSVLFFLLLSTVATSGSAQTQGSENIAALHPGDQIRIVVWRKPEMSGDFPISANGTVAHPLYRDIQVTGLSISAVEDRFRTFLTKYETNPQFVIQALVRIVVAGEVRTPNVYSVPPETTIGQALALAGGPTDRGELKSVKVVRDRQTISIDLSGPDSDASILQIRSGDQILIGRRKASAASLIAPVSSTIAAIAAIISIIITSSSSSSN
jgi:polysaccharide biosynthesis/export protein VpsN